MKEKMNNILNDVEKFIAETRDEKSKAELVISIGLNGEILLKTNRSKKY